MFDKWSEKLRFKLTVGKKRCWQVIPTITINPIWSFLLLLWQHHLASIMKPQMVVEVPRNTHSIWSSIRILHSNKHAAMD